MYDYGVLMHSNVSVLNTIEMYILKWLRWASQMAQW